MLNLPLTWRTAKIGVMGSGVVGQTLAEGLLELGFQVMRGTRTALS